MPILLSQSGEYSTTKTIPAIQANEFSGSERTISSIYFLPQMPSTGEGDFITKIISLFVHGFSCGLMRTKKTKIPCQRTNEYQFSMLHRNAAVSIGTTTSARIDAMDVNFFCTGYYAAV